MDTPVRAPSVPSRAGGRRAAPAATAIALLSMAAAPSASGDSVRVVLPSESAGLLGEGPAGGRVILFLAGPSAPVGTPPSDAPYLPAPQPVFSVEVEALRPGVPVTIDASAPGFPGPIDAMDGTFRAQAVFRRVPGERGHLGAGNLVSGTREISLSANADDVHEIRLATAIAQPEAPAEPNLRAFAFRSEALSRAAGHDVTMRAGVVLPPGWDDPNHRRRLFPAVYVVPSFGRRWTDAGRIARLLADPDTSALVPQAVHVVLDPEAPLGHHGFVDSPANGPWGTALAEELIPALEREFRLVPRREARIVTGHSSGGWSALWLQVAHPDTFGACFASSPDPVDFSRFQSCDLYRDANLWTDAEGRERPMFRTVVAPGFEKVGMTVREGLAIERVLGPGGTSGEQWDTWAAMWGPLAQGTRLPRPPCDRDTGAIDRAVIDGSWSRFDIAGLVRRDPGGLVPLLRERARVLCGADDNFLLDRAVSGLGEAIAAGAEALMARGEMVPAGPGYVEVVPGLDHRSMFPAASLRWHGEMREHLRRNGLD